MELLGTTKSGVPVVTNRSVAATKHSMIEALNQQATATARHRMRRVKTVVSDDTAPIGQMSTIFIRHLSHSPPIEEPAT